jgi:endonuclease YncB( thermonuclease family)
MASATAPKVHVGTAQVIDGDSLRVGGVSIRLFGIDAPEAAQMCEGKAPVQCGAAAHRFVEQMTGNQAVACEQVAIDRYKRVVAICRLPDGREVNAEIVRAGHAVAYRRYSTRYVVHEAEAKQRGLGLWGLGFAMPEDFRKDRRR